MNYYAKCPCGWTSPVLPNDFLAFDALSDHCEEAHPGFVCLDGSALIPVDLSIGTPGA